MRAARSYPGQLARRAYAEQMAVLQDGFGRTVTDMRLSLTDKCNLRCTYCMPAEGLPWLTSAELLSDDEIVRLVGAAASLGVTTVRSRRHELTPVEGRGSAPAEVWWVDGGPARVGVVGSVTRPFCGTCDRIRLTADGQLRTCLFAREESDLRTPLRAGADEAALQAAFVTAIAGKKAGHGINDPAFLQPDRPMSAIGG